MGAALLIPEPPLQVLPSLAGEVGVNEAIFLQQVHYWSLRSSDDEGWVYRTQPEWLEELPWLTIRTLQRVVKVLRDAKLLETKQPEGTSRRTYYRVLYDRLPDAAKLAASSRQIGGMTNNKTEITTEKGKRSKKKATKGEARKAVAGKVVTDDELELTAAIIRSFNAVAGTALREEDSPHTTPIVGRIRERPDLTAENHDYLIRAVFEGDNWWTNPASPKIIYGNAGQFEQSVEIARAKMRANAEAYDVNEATARIRKEQGL